MSHTTLFVEKVPVKVNRSFKSSLTRQPLPKWIDCGNFAANFRQLKLICLPENIWNCLPIFASSGKLLINLLYFSRILPDTRLCLQILRHYRKNFWQTPLNLFWWKNFNYHDCILYMIMILISKCDLGRWLSNVKLKIVLHSEYVHVLYYKYSAELGIWFVYSLNCTFLFIHCALIENKKVKKLFFDQAWFFKNHY